MKNLTLEDIHFKLGVREVWGIIHAEQGIPLFYSEKESIISPLPFFVSAKQYERPIIVYMRPHTNEIIERFGFDDKLISELNDDEEDVIGEYSMLKVQMTEQKMRIIPRAVSIMGLFGINILLLIAALIFRLLGIMSTWIPVIALSATFAVLAFLTYSYTRILNQNIIYDADGQWVNFDTGETSLNGGYRVDLTKGV